MLLKELLSAYRNNDKPLYLVIEDVGEWVSAGIIYCATYSTVADITIYAIETYIDFNSGESTIKIYEIKDDNWFEIGG